MKLDSLIDKYIEQAKFCSDVDYGDKKSVKSNNKAVNKMYEIVTVIGRDFGGEGVERFSALLDITEHQVNVWAAAQLFDKLKADKTIRLKALNIIKAVAKGNDVNALGFQYWLKEREKEIELLDHR
jgi:hypothetical protein